MTQTERAAFVENFLSTYCLPVMASKGGEYSRGEADVNSNFKRVGEGSGISALKTAYVYAAKHWDSISNYVKNDGKVALTEPIEGRLGDMLNYILILASLIEEEKPTPADLLKL